MASTLLPEIQLKDPVQDFELLSQIGSGGYGVVYKAKTVSDGQLCALKIIKIKAGEDFNLIQKEISILSHCKHPNIVGYYSSYLRKDKLWISMEFCEAGSLYNMMHVQHSGLNELQIAFVCKETLQGLTYLHERNILHRDIKSANILLTHDTVVKLADFGIATQLTQTMGKRKTFIGTPYWMAPEVAAVDKKGGYNQKCDIWSLGITAIELAEMQPPMNDLHPFRALQLLTKRAFQPPGLQHKNKWSNNFHDFISHCLKKDTSKRPTARDLLKDDFVKRDLSGLLMGPLMKAFEASSTASAPPDDQSDFELGQPRKRIASIARKKTAGQASTLAIPGLQLTPTKGTLQEAIPAWLEVVAESNDRKGIKPTTSPPCTSPVDTTLRSIANGGVANGGVEERGRACFTKIFKGCPLQVHCAGSWIHPIREVLFVLLGTQEGLFYLQVNREGDPIIEQMSPRSCLWLRVVENVLVWLSDSDHMISMTNLILLFQNEQEIAARRGGGGGGKDGETFRRNRRIRHSSKIKDSIGCFKCSIVVNPYNKEKYLIAAVPKGILLMQWYQISHAFMLVKLFECSLPSPLVLFEAFVLTQEDEYPTICVGVNTSTGDNVLFNTISLNPSSSSITVSHNSDITKLEQVEKDTILILDSHCAKFVDISGSLKAPEEKMASSLYFDKESVMMVYLQNYVLSFNDHGLQGKSLLTEQVTAEVIDHSKKFKLLCSDGTIIVETKRADNPSYPSSLYLLESEEAT
ncbi:PREDICTED: mitogen-activated protein kinase kinase kinase kinase 5-like [Amphimedon queenslandica]|uniref:Mitogen-activated protein kinase kinase kinase kinase n=1 Tax=Amphimedon queenslandica TaxID=400682 RepID=A0A1X7V3D7_AMPQE|nr:PREDICTED: mitogen-activated protein kinase kinase kinase kinase 5-like [Amphimedon queenslandica]|eukprot:XP_019850848.1 PREDICTED: mitogen-activated protein kinase kinase kinase kinase 5-like [Amphimedon queenslandica]